MNEQFMKEIKDWESQYRTMNNKLSKRQMEILGGSELKSHEGMVFGKMYSDWKKQKGYD